MDRYETDRYERSPGLVQAKKGKGVFGSYLVLSSYGGSYHFKLVRSVIRSGTRSIDDPLVDPDQ